MKIVIYVPPTISSKNIYFHNKLCKKYTKCSSSSSSSSISISISTSISSSSSSSSSRVVVIVVIGVVIKVLFVNLFASERKTNYKTRKSTIF